jgi:zinc transport system ATP-binding protein
MDPLSQDLIKNDTLNIFNGNELIFSSRGNWLNPLFEAEEFFNKSTTKYDNLMAHDTAGGKAAAALMIRFKIKKVRFNLVSDLAANILKQHNVELLYDRKVEKLKCMTEDMLKDTDNIDEIYAFLRVKSGRVAGLSIDIKNLSIGYNKKAVFKNLNLNLKAGECKVIQGENGIGKTTLIRTLLGEIPPVNGSITIDGKNITQIDKGIIGYIKQEKEKQDFPTSVREVVSMGVREKLNKRDMNYLVETSLRKCRAQDLIDRNYYTLSGGEKQRVSIARTIAQKARILIFDEPTSFLDQNSEKELVELLQTLGTTQMPTIICITHDTILIKRLNWQVCKMERPKEC